MNVNSTFEYLSVGLPEDIQRLKTYGNFKEAIRLIDLRLEEKGLVEPLRNCLIVQREIIKRIPVDFPYTKEEAIALAKEKVADFTEEEFDSLIEKRKIRWIYIDGKMHVFRRFFRTLCVTNPEFAKRAGEFKGGSESEATEPKYSVSMRESVIKNGTFSNRFKIKAWIRMNDDEFKPGMEVKVHLPIPIENDEQSDITFDKIYPENGVVSPGDAEQRTICWQETMEENHEFFVEYSYTYTAKYKDPLKIKADKVQPTFCTEEKAPHIAFTPYIRSLVDSLTEGITDPVGKAKRIYDFITLNMNYTFMPNYFVLENITESCARSYTGDCGVFALLFITLLRYAGIPAAWESGLAVEPDFIGEHDWAKFYIAPYGWMFADVSYGVSSARNGDEERRNYYFGNLDSFRMAANREFQGSFTIDKEHWRVDPYDNQCGEFETKDFGLDETQFNSGFELLDYKIL